MSDPIEMSDVAQRYRELGREDVPPELDRRVLDAARAAVASEKGGRARSWLKWSAPLALAASVVLVVTVVIESGVQNDASFATKVAQEKPQEPQPQPHAAPPAPFVADETAAAQAEPKTLAKSANATKTEEAQRRKSAAPEEVRVQAQSMRDEVQLATPVSPPAQAIDRRESQLAISQPAPSIPETVAAADQISVAGAQADSAEHELNEVAVTGTRVRRAGRTAGPRGTASPAALSSERRPAADADAERSDPAKWLEEIRDLRRDGKTVEADRAWERFREAFPDFPVAEHDLARKK